MAPTRAHQHTAPGFGNHFVSPTKVRDPKKTTTRVVVPGQAAKHQKLLAKLKALQNPIEPLLDDTNHPQSQDIESYAADIDCVGQEPDSDLRMTDPPNHPTNDQPPTAHKSRLIHDTTPLRLYDSWKGLIRSLVHPFLEYLTVSTTCVHPPTGDIRSTCPSTTCALKTTNMTVLFFDRLYTLFH